MAASDKSLKTGTTPKSTAGAPAAAAPVPAKKSAAAKPKPCTSFFVKVDVLTPDDDHEIHFGISKTCNQDGTATWSLVFTLMELTNGQMKTRVNIEAQVGPENDAAMDKLAASRTLTEDQKDTLAGPVADMVMALPPGSSGTPETKAAIVEAVTS
jgi:hypothetical protein